MAIYFHEADWRTVRRCSDADGVAAIPLGSLEQHGPHLPCGTDTIQIDEVMKRALERIPAEAPVCVCPTVQYSVVQWASPMASAGVQPLTLEHKLIDICHALTDLGFEKLLLVHGHGGLPSGRSAMWQAVQEKRPALYVDFMPFDACAEQLEKICGKDGHGGCGETSMMLAIRPDLVDMSKAVKGPDDLWGPDCPYPSLQAAGVYAIPSVAAVREGIYGNATIATAEIGNQILDLLAETTAKLIHDLAIRPVPDHVRLTGTLMPVPDEK